VIVCVCAGQSTCVYMTLCANGCTHVEPFVCVCMSLLSSPLQIKEPQCSGASMEESWMIGDSVAGMAACTHTGDWTSRGGEEWQRVHTQEIGLA